MTKKNKDSWKWIILWFSAVLLLISQMCVFWVGSVQNRISWNLISVIFVFLGILGVFTTYKVKGKMHGLIFLFLCVLSALVFGIKQIRILLPVIKVGREQPAFYMMIILLSEGIAYTLARYKYKYKALYVPSHWYKNWEVEIGAVFGIVGSIVLWFLLRDFEFSLIFFALGVFLGIYGLYFGTEMRKRFVAPNNQSHH